MVHHTLCFSCIRHKFLWVGVGSNQSFWLSSLALLQWVVKLVLTHWELGDTWAWIPTKSISQITVIQIDQVEYKKTTNLIWRWRPKSHSWRRRSMQLQIRWRLGLKRWWWCLITPQKRDPISGRGQTLEKNKDKGCYEIVQILQDKLDYIGFTTKQRWTV